MKHADVTLEDKYVRQSGQVFLTGLQALVRLPLDQRRADEAAGLKTGGFISGYRGSPLGGYDTQLFAAKKHLDAHGVVFQPGLNEDLAATSVWGTQMVGLTPGARVNGVFGIWYGKTPGVDRSGDAFRHANFAGTSRYGGVLAVAGDDPNCKSSTLPSQSEVTLAGVDMPILTPSSIQEVLDYGLYGIAMSRFSGLWSSMIVWADTMDASAVIDVDPSRLEIKIPEFEFPADGVHLHANDTPLNQEYRLRAWKRPAVKAFVRANRLDRVLVPARSGREPRLGVITTGEATRDVFEAMHSIGLTPQLAAELGLVVYKVAVPFPLEEEGALEFCAGKEAVLVVEHKRSFIETQLKELLYHAPAGGRPRVLGKTDDKDEPLLPWHGTIKIPQIARAIFDLLPEGPHRAEAEAYLARAEAALAPHERAPGVAERKPYFCSGCPHNTSTMHLPEGSRALAGIGCHYMAVWMNPFTGFFSHMGGEGASWIGQAPFTDENHIFVNLGDGTYSHSGSLAIRAAVAANVNVTYKILYNSAVAMTGGQAPDMSAVTVPDIAAQVLAEGAKTCVVVTEDTGRYASVALPDGVRLYDRKDLDRVQERLKNTPGVTVLIYDQMCATERRRKRKRGKLPAGEKRVWIHPEVCEGCGDCSRASNCLSVEPLETELGRKRQINQSTCNQDYSCLEGFCPSFVTLYGAEPVHPKPATLDFDAATLPTPPPVSIGEGEAWSIVLSGVGGTGVTTVAAILGMAAHIDGRASSTLDMTGLAQKGGAVFSHVRIAKAPEHIYSARVPPATADVMLAADMVVADSPEADALMRKGRTTAVYNLDVAPTAQFVGDRDAAFDPDAHRAALLDHADDGGGLEAERLAVDALGDAIYTNMIVAGFAWQKGLIPVSSRAVERAIKLNGVKIDENRAAFDLGRLAAVDPARAAGMLEPARETVKEMTLDELIAHREKLLTNYQNADYAKRYRAAVDTVRAAESALGGGERLTRAAAFNLAKLMAYKDEYEVARLFVSTDWESHLKQHFDGTKRIAFNLAPPILAPKNPRTGAPEKREFGAWMKLGFKLLAKMKGLRGTAWDVFGRSEERRAERALVERYEATLKRLIAELRADNYDLAVEIASIPDAIRGYGHVKAAAMEAAAENETALWTLWERKAAA